jgi:SM-20-related protein
MGITRVYENIFEEEVFGKLMAARKDWHFGFPEGGEPGVNSYWTYRPLHDKKTNLADLSFLPQNPELFLAWDIARQRFVPPGYRLIRGYWNCYNYGMWGTFHQDGPRPDEITTVIYMMPKWDPNWAGETVVASGNGYECCMPAPNRAFLFPSSAKHVARASSRSCPMPRTIIVLRARASFSDLGEKLSYWLIQNGALKLKHSIGTIHDHMMRCFLLCEARKMPPAVCLGAGLHAIYGTATFKHKMIEPTDDNRRKVIAAWGQDVEALAYNFGVLVNRTSILEQSKQLTAMVLALRLAEAANCLDCGQGLEKWPNIKRTWDTWDKLVRDHADSQNLHMPGMQPHPQTNLNGGSMGTGSASLSEVFLGRPAAGF